METNGLEAFEKGESLVCSFETGVTRCATTLNPKAGLGLQR